MKNALGSVQTVLVLGGDSDIANATLKELIRRRTRNVILAGRNLDRLEERANAMRQSGSVNVEVVEFDATASNDAHQAFVEEFFERQGDIDLVLLTFGRLGNQERDETNAPAALQTAQVNYVGAVSVLIPIVEKLKQQGHGTIVTLSTVAAERARRSNFIYGSSKAGLDSFAQGLQDTLQGSGVHVLIVRPGFARSKMTEGMDVPPLATTPNEVAHAIINGITRNREIVWVPGKLQWVMSILRHLPRPLFRRLNL